MAAAEAYPEAANKPIIVASSRALKTTFQKSN
jgi:hypothetical protein